MSEQWSETVTQQVPPDARFRAELHRALEETHRQQVARRKVGATGSGAPEATLQRWARFVLALLLAIAVVGLVFRRRNPPPVTA